MEKTLQVNIFAIILLSISMNCFGKRDFFSYLPEDSLIKSQCEQAGNGIFFIKNRVQTACDCIDEVIGDKVEKKALDTNDFIEVSCGNQSGFHLADSYHGKLQRSVLTILENESKEVKAEELRKLLEFYGSLRQKILDESHKIISESFYR